MLLQTNSYVVPRDRKAEHARLVRRFRQTFTRLGCDNFEVYEQVGSNWSAGESSGRFVQIMRFRDRRHQLAVQEAERNDPDAQSLIAEFCELINFAYQRQQGLFAVGFYIGVLPSAARRQPDLLEKGAGAEGEIEDDSAAEAEADAASAHKPAAPAQPALVEPGAATRAPIIPAVGPGQVPLVTPASTLAHDAESYPSEPEAGTDTAAEPTGGEPSISESNEPILPLGEFEEVTNFDDAAEPLIADAPADELPAELAGAPAPAVSPSAHPRWQTSDELEDAIEGDVTTDLTDADENGQVRVADEALLKAEADFAAHAAMPVGAFDEIPEKPPVLEGTLEEDFSISDEIPAAPMNDDDALAALEMPLVNGESAVEPGHLEKEINHLSEEHDGTLDDLETLPDPAEHKGK